MNKREKKIVIGGVVLTSLVSAGFSMSQGSISRADDNYKTPSSLKAFLESTEAEGGEELEKVIEVATEEEDINETPAPTHNENTWKPDIDEEDNQEGTNPGEGEEENPGGTNPGEGEGENPGGTNPGEGEGENPGGTNPGEGEGENPGGTNPGEDGNNSGGSEPEEDKDSSKDNEQQGIEDELE